MVRTRYQEGPDRSHYHDRLGVEGSPPAEVTIYQASVTLTDAQIKALRATPFEIVAPTESLGGSGSPTTLPIPIAAFAVSNLTAAYTNLEADQDVMFVWGADETFAYSLQATAAVVGQGLFSTEGDQFLSPVGVAPTVDQASTLADLFNDNGLYFTLNAGTGALTGGNAANSLKVTVWYGIFEV